MNYLANFLTGLSLISGFASIIFSLERHFTFASWAIILSVIFDGLDGQVARMNPVPSEFGKELDSLVDVVSFGIAPAILGYIFIYHSFYLWVAIVLFIYLVCCVFRLARYNITSKEEMINCFIGLPTNISGGILASFILVYRKYEQLPPPPVLSLFLVFILAFLMVSKVKYPNLEYFKKNFKKSVPVVSGIIFIIFIVSFLFYRITSVFLPELSVLTIFSIYLIFSPALLLQFREHNT